MAKYSDIIGTVVNGERKAFLKEGDVAASSGLFEIDIDGGLMPVTDNLSDQYYELDTNDDIMPK